MRWSLLAISLTNHTLTLWGVQHNPAGFDCIRHCLEQEHTLARSAVTSENKARVLGRPGVGSVECAGHVQGDLPNDTRRRPNGQLFVNLAGQAKSSQLVIGVAWKDAGLARVQRNDALLQV